MKPLLAVLILFAACSDTTLQTLPFEIGGSGFRAQDAIQIQTFQGTKPILEAGGYYVVTGKYRLTSTDEATLAAYVTNGEVVEAKNSIVISRGEGTFELPFFVEKPGYPHVSLYSRENRTVIGGIYFGSGKFLLREAKWLRGRR